MSTLDGQSTQSDDSHGDKPYSRQWWLAKIEAEKKAHKPYRDEAEIAAKAFSPPDEATQSQYPIFWSNTKITHGALYARTPKPDVRKRYKDADEKQAPKRVALAIERALSFTLDHEDIDDHAHRCVDDFLVAGLGASKIEYEAVTQQVPVMNPMTGVPELDKDGKPLTTEVITSQKVTLEYIPWDRFLWEPSKDWDDVTWVGILHWMSRRAAKDKFKVDIKDTDSGPTGVMTKPGQPNEAKYEGQVGVYEIWCKITRKLHWIGKTAEEIDVTEDDPLNLENFFPFPRPMMLNIKFGSLIPKTDYSYICKQCVYVDTLTARISALTKQIKDTGCYDSSFPELAEVLNPNVEDGTFKPINQLLARLQKMDGVASFDAIIARADNVSKVNVVQTLLQMREQAIQAIYQITGISDIVRGATEASETAEAQRLKGQWANVRLVEKQSQVNGMFREIFRIMAEIIGEHFTPEIIMRMTGLQLTPEEMEILKNDASRNFAIDVETDSTIAVDQQQDNAQRMELVNTFQQYFSATQPMVAQGLMPATLQKEILSVAVGGMKYAGSLSDAIDQLPDNAKQLQDMGQQLQQSQRQIEQMGQQMQEMQKQLQQADMGKQSVEQTRLQLEAEKVRQAGQKTNSEVQGNQFDADKTFAETQEILARIGQIEATIQATDAGTMATRVGADKEARTPIKDPNQPPPMRPRPGAQ